MRKLRFGRPSPAMVVASIALLVALGGTAIAAKKIGSNQIKKGAVKTKKIANRAVTKGKLADAAVSSEKLADAAVLSNKLAQDAVATGKIQSDAVTQGKLADDSVGTAQLLADSVGGNKLRANAVTGDKVLDGSLGLSKVAQVIAEVSFDANEVPAGECIAEAQTVPGAQPGDAVMASIVASDNAGSFVAVSGEVLAPSNVLLGVCNVTGDTATASITQRVALFR